MMAVESEYKPYIGYSCYTWFDAEMFPTALGPDILPRNIFSLLKGSEITSPSNRRDYPTREAAMADLAQAQERLKVMEGMTVETTKTTAATATASVVEPGKPISIGKIRTGDTVRIVRTLPSGTKTITEGEVESVSIGNVSFITGASYGCEVIPNLYAGSICTAFLLHRPPQRREISKQELIESVPIGTRVTLVKVNGGEIDGTLQVVGRDNRGLGAHLGPNISSTIYVNLDDFKTAYIEGEPT